MFWVAANRRALLGGGFQPADVPGAFRSREITVSGGAFDRLGEKTGEMDFIEFQNQNPPLIIPDLASICKLLRDKSQIPPADRRKKSPDGVLPSSANHAIIFLKGGSPLAYDFKKADPLLYNPKPSPGLLRVPCMPFLSVDGSGDPNTPGGAYQRAVEALYAVAYTLRMSPKAGYLMDGYFSYVVPPLEGFWRMADADCAIDYANKQNFQWTSMIRLPDFVTNEDVDWAKREVEQKKGLDSSLVSRRVLDEGLCAQILHPGSFDDEPETVARLNAFILDSGHLPDFSDSRRHHEIYLSDPRKVAPEKRRTVIRHPIRPK